MTKTFYEFIMRVQAIAKIGLKFSKDPYALENYQELNDVSLNMLKNFMGLNFEEPNYFTKDAYPTPNVSVRVLLINDKDEILYVKEKDGEGYTLPGGWADINQSPVEAAVTECFQEAGATVTIDALVGVYDFSSQSVGSSQYCLVFLGKVIGPLVPFGHEILEVKYVHKDQLPTPISWKLPRPDLKRMIVDAFKDKAHFE
jgi:8-oxo-dGTP diphosphatase